MHEYLEVAQQPEYEILVTDTIIDFMPCFLEGSLMSPVTTPAL